MVPWYRRTDKNPPKGNAQLEAGLDRLKDYLFDPSNRRKVKDNMTAEQRQAMGQLRNLPDSSNAQVTFTFCNQKSGLSGSVDTGSAD